MTTKKVVSILGNNRVHPTPSKNPGFPMGHNCA